MRKIKITVTEKDFRDAQVAVEIEGSLTSGCPNAFAISRALGINRHNICVGPFDFYIKSGSGPYGLRNLPQEAKDVIHAFNTLVVHHELHLKLPVEFEVDDPR